MEDATAAPGARREAIPVRVLDTPLGRVQITSITLHSDDRVSIEGRLVRD